MDEIKADLAHAIRVDPKNAAALRDRADFAANDDLAIADYTSSITINPKDAEAFVGRGYIYGRHGDKERAYADYSQAIKIDPQNSEALLYRGDMNRGMGENDAAAADFSAAIEADPKNPNPYMARAALYEDVRHDKDKAIQDYLQAVRVDTAAWRKAPTYSKIAVLYTDMGKLDRAIATLTEAIHALPKESRVYRERAEAYKKGGQGKRGSRGLGSGKPA